MNCECRPKEKYICFDCESKRKVKSLTIRDRTKLRMYKKMLDENINSGEKLETIILYMASRGLDSGLIKFL